LDKPSYFTPYRQSRSLRYLNVSSSGIADMSTKSFIVQKLARHKMEISLTFMKHFSIFAPE